MIFFTKSTTKKLSVYRDPVTKASRRDYKKIFLLVCIMSSLMLISSKMVRAENAVPGMPGPITGQINVCAYVGSSQGINYSISPVAGAELYLWTVPPTVQIVSGQGTTNIRVNFLTGFSASPNKQIKVRAISQDGNSADRLLYLVSQQPSTPSIINGPTNACLYIGTPNPAIYTTARDANATGYIWAADPTTTNITHPNGPGVNDTIIRVLFKNGFKTNPISVQAINNCGFSSSRAVTVSGSAPTAPGVISGPTNACAYMLPNGTSATYSINPVVGATYFNWTVPDGSLVTHPNGSGAGDITITVQYPDNFTGGAISVIASSGCDDSPPRSLSVNKLNPSTPGIITPVQKIVCPDREFSYSLPSMPANAVAINWTIPAEALSFSGQGTPSITVLYSALRVNGTVTATAVNNCASSAMRQSVVSLNRCQVERSANNNNRIGNDHSDEEKIIKPQTTSAVPEKMQVTIAPNPSKGSFKLQALSKSKEMIILKLLDLQGREMKKMIITQGQPVIFGNELRSGTYILEVSQGNERHTEKLLKL